MKNILTWAKANLWIVILSAVAVFVLPAGWLGSSMWNGNIRREREKNVSADAKKLADNQRFRYTGLQLHPDAPAVEHTYPPNKHVTEFFKNLREQQGEQLKRIVAAAVEHNRRGHGVLVEGLLPGPATPGARTDLQAIAMARMIVPGASSGPSVYEKLLTDVGAGGPASPSEVGRALADLKARELERIRAKGGENPTPEEDKEITEKLVNQRIGEYRKRAEQVSVYATTDIFPRNGSPAIPDRLPDVPPSLLDAFEWQHDIWTVEDILAAVKAANTGPGGEALMVPDAPVKRIISLRLDPLERLVVPGEGETVDPGTDPAAAIIQGDLSDSITGRWSSINQLFDVRNVYLELVVAMDRLPTVLNAISQTNFMTVLDLDLAPVEAWTDLERGYYYGSDYVVKATMKIETLWLRAWTKQFMPREWRLSLGIPDDPAPEAGGGG